MKPPRMIVVDELAMFMNVGWPGEEWYLSDHAEYLWEETFEDGGANGLYRPRTPGTLVNLNDFEARLRWQGRSPDPTRGAGQKLSELFLRWQRKQTSAIVSAYVPREQEATIRNWLQAAGCMLLNDESPTCAGGGAWLSSPSERLEVVDERTA